jgi:hypothetical protein
MTPSVDKESPGNKPYFQPLYFVGSTTLPRNKIVPLPFSRIRKMNG